MTIGLGDPIGQSDPPDQTAGTETGAPARADAEATSGPVEPLRGGS